MRPPKPPQTNKDAIIFRKEGWLEHLEKEVDPNLREDLELLLKNSDSDRKVFAGLRATRELVKKSDDVLMPESGAYYEDLHDKIMSAIAAEPAKGSTFMRGRGSKSVAWRTFAGVTSMTMMMALVTWVSVKTSVPSADVRNTAAVEESTQRFDRDLAGVTVPETDVSSELNGYESEAEFVTAALEEKLKNLPPDQAEALLASLER